MTKSRWNLASSASWRRPSFEQNNQSVSLRIQINSNGLKWYSFRTPNEEETYLPWGTTKAANLFFDLHCRSMTCSVYFGVFFADFGSMSSMNTSWLLLLSWLIWWHKVAKCWIDWILSFNSSILVNLSIFVSQGLNSMSGLMRSIFLNLVQTTANTGNGERLPLWAAFLLFELLSWCSASSQRHIRIIQPTVSKK